ncbi:MAG: T9SS type A sorting domain-containing protein [Chitinophagaceae bacterium]|jgi:hypothetical protein|nr:T9SS type A sorting domain-containing protein [Chitinophagaceae bacterium]
MNIKATCIPLYGRKIIALCISTMMWVQVQSQYYDPSINLPYFNSLNDSAPAGVWVFNYTTQAVTFTPDAGNDKHFIVQHSTDGITWQAIGMVNSFFLTGTGNGHTYSYTDKNLLPGNNFYRLQQVDISGSAELSSVVNASYDKNTVMYISPNPAKGAIKIHHLPENALVRIIDITGAAYSFSVKDGNINIGSLSAGVYFVQVNVSNSVIAKLKFVKR